MKKKLLLLTLAALCAAGISAKKGINIGVEAGYDFAHYRDYIGDAVETIIGSENQIVTTVQYQHSQQCDHYTQTVVNGKYTNSGYGSTPTGRLPQMHGFHVGPTFDWRFAESHGLGLRFALQYQFLTTNGGVFDWKDSNGNRYYPSNIKDPERSLLYALIDNTYSHNLDIPIRLSYTWTVKNDWSIWLMTGPKFNIGLSYTSSGTYKEAKATFNYYTGELTAEVRI